MKKDSIVLKMRCDCKDWEPGMKKINGPVHGQQVRGGFWFSDDHFIEMKYCPWCGEGLEKDEEPEGELEKNYAFFESNLEDWLKNPAFKRKHVVIYQKEVKGVYDQFASAIKFATAHFPQGEFNIQKVTDNTSGRFFYVDSEWVHEADLSLKDSQKIMDNLVRGKSVQREKFHSTKPSN